MEVGADRPKEVVLACAKALWQERISKGTLGSPGDRRVIVAVVGGKI